MCVCVWGRYVYTFVGSIESCKAQQINTYYIRILIRIEGNHNLFNLEICIEHILCSIALVGNTENTFIF